MDKELVELIDNMIANGWSNDPDGDRSFAYISIGGLLIVMPKDKPVRRFRLTEVK